MYHEYTFRVQARDLVGHVSDWITTTVAIVNQTKYYFLDGRRVAMRQGDKVYYLYGDHLGSTSLATDEDGTVVYKASYLPYGGERLSDGVSPTDFGFTDQRNEVGLGLMDYDARYYDPFLGRFISPDTIAPNPADGQTFDRYAYVMGNPVRLTDPTGHCPPSICRDAEGRPADQYYRYGDRGDPPALSGVNPWYPVDHFVTRPSSQEMSEYRLKAIKAYGKRYVHLSERGDVTHLEAMARITEFAAQLYGPDETYAFGQNLGEIFVSFSGPLSPWYGFCDCAPRSNYTIHKGPDRERLVHTGFVGIFQDGSAQPRHFWFAVQLEMIYPTEFVIWQAFGHEDPNNRLLGRGRGGSEGDIILSLLGSELGRGLDNGTIEPAEVGDWLRTHLGEEHIHDYRLK